jgi:hypothetical protein
VVHVSCLLVLLHVTEMDFKTSICSLDYIGTTIPNFPFSLALPGSSHCSGNPTLTGVLCSSSPLGGVS